MVDSKRPLEEIENEIAELSARIDEATYRLLLAIREFDDRGGWADQGARSCAHWLNWRVGLDLGAAREKVRVAHALPQFPLIADALRRGEVSYSKVRAVTRVATPETEGYLLDIARAGTAAHVEKLVRGYRRVTREEAERQQTTRHLRTWWGRDGMLYVEGRLPPEAGALLLKALEAAGEALYQNERRDAEAAHAKDVCPESGRDAFPDAPVPGSLLCPPPSPVTVAEGREPSAGITPASSAAAVPPNQPSTTVVAPISAETPSTQPTPSFWYATQQGSGPRQGRFEKQADALVFLAESALGEGMQGASTTADRYQVVLHVDAEALCDGAASGRSHLEGGPDLSAETFRRIACDSSLVRILESPSGEPLDVGRKTRAIPPALRRALNARDHGCRWPGCASRRFLHVHHIRNWADGGETSLANTALLCRHHHALVHEHGYGIVCLPSGELSFRDPRGRVIAPTGTLPPATGDPLRALAAHVADPGVLGSSPFPTWLGERMDYNTAVGWLLDRNGA